MTRVGVKQETEIWSAFVCIAASQNAFGRFLDAICILLIFHITNVCFGFIKRYLNTAFQFPFLAVCVLTCSEVIYILSDRYEFRFQLMSATLLSIPVFLLHLTPKTHFSERENISKSIDNTNWEIGLIFLALILLSIAIETTIPVQSLGLLVVQLIAGSFLIVMLNRLFGFVKRVSR